VQSKDLRNRYLDFFKSKDHEIIGSDMLVPRNDPTLLFTGAGMNQFKEQFIGMNITYTRAASCQKCLRTGDLENVGKTSGHHTFFEMLGNFSFGDYFKQEACDWAWEFMTQVLGLPEEKLWVSVYKDDDEAYHIWKDKIHIPQSKIVKLGARDNFWPANAPKDGPNGTCGPCSEIFYDWGEEAGCGKHDCGPACDCGRFIEVWNLVFTQFSRIGVEQLEALPSKNIDTGMGLERVTAVMQGVRTNFETDLFVPIVKEIEAVCAGVKKSYANAIADHIRAAIFCISDGVSPSNEERGYVVRKLIRRAYLYSRADRAFLYTLVSKVVNVMESAYPELRERRDDITAVIKEEEERFQNTLLTALPKLDDILGTNKTSGIIPGKDVFKLVDTYGLPIEVIAEKVKQAGCKYDRDEFERLMDERKELSRSGSKIEQDIFVESGFQDAPCPVTSDSDPLEAKIIFMAKDKQKTEHAKKGDKVAILTDPQSALFYTEAGGQIGDTGTIKKDNAAIRIVNTYKIDGRTVHDCIVGEGNFSIFDNVRIELDSKRKQHVAKHHTATHLLHSALKKVLGEHVRQSGSLVEDKRLRFDFTHMKKMSDMEIERVEDLVNEKIQQSINVVKEVKTKEDAEKEGAIALFGEKYGDQVRIVSISGYSKEFCGGTHVDNTHDIKVFKIITETSIASGVRRIEALTDISAEDWLREDAARLIVLYNEARDGLGENGEAIAYHREIENMISECENLKKQESNISWKELKDYTYTIKPEIEDGIEYFSKLKKRVQKKQKANNINEIEQSLDDMIREAQIHDKIRMIVEELQNADMNILRKTADMIKKRSTSTFIALGSASQDKANIIVTFTDDIKARGVDATMIIKEAAKVVNGSGGGRKDFAQAGGKDVSRVKDALKKAEEVFLGSL